MTRLTMRAMAVVVAAILLAIVSGSAALGERCTCSDKIVQLMDDKDFRLVYSPDYPRPYCPELDCVWRVVAPNNESHVQFYSANLDLHPDDSIFIYDGKEEDRLNASMTCTEHNVCDFVSAGQYLTIEFVSGSTENNHKGFQGAVIVLSDYELVMTSWFYIAGLVLLVFGVALLAGALILCLLRKRRRSRTPNRNKNNDPLLQ